MKVSRLTVEALRSLLSNYRDDPRLVVVVDAAGAEHQITEVSSRPGRTLDKDAIVLTIGKANK